MRDNWDRSVREALADELRRRGVGVFYDKYEKATLWGKDLYTHLIDVYQRKARYSIMLLSQHYGWKLWTHHERQAAQRGPSPNPGSTYLFQPQSHNAPPRTFSNTP